MNGSEFETEVVVVLVTFPDRNTCLAIGEALVEKRLCACVNVVPGAVSVYEWEGKICRDEESIGLVKTTRSKLPDLEKQLLELHPYDQPEFLVLPVEAGNAGYLDWVSRITSA